MGETHRVRYGKEYGATVPSPGTPPSQHLHVFTNLEAKTHPLGFYVWGLCYIDPFCFPRNLGFPRGLVPQVTTLSGFPKVTSLTMQVWLKDAYSE
jgi:hypothetical protein